MINNNMDFLKIWFNRLRGMKIIKLFKQLFKKESK